MGNDIENLWKAIQEDREDITDVRVQQASVAQILLNIQKGVDEIKQTVNSQADRARMNDERNGQQDVTIAELEKDVDALGSKIRAHLSQHNWWAMYIVAIASMVAAVFKIWWKNP